MKVLLLINLRLLEIANSFLLNIREHTKTPDVIPVLQKKPCVVARVHIRSDMRLTVKSSLLHTKPVL